MYLFIILNFILIIQVALRINRGGAEYFFSSSNYVNVFLFVLSFAINILYIYEFFRTADFIEASQRTGKAEYYSLHLLFKNIIIGKVLLILIITLSVLRMLMTSKFGKSLLNLYYSLTFALHSVMCISVLLFILFYIQAQYMWYVAGSFKFFSYINSKVMIKNDLSDTHIIPNSLQQNEMWLTVLFIFFCRAGSLLLTIIIINYYILTKYLHAGESQPFNLYAFYLQEIKNFCQSIEKYFKKHKRLSAGSDSILSRSINREVNTNFMKKRKLNNQMSCNLTVSNMKACMQRNAVSEILNVKKQHMIENYRIIEVNNKLDCVIMKLNAF